MKSRYSAMFIAGLCLIATGCSKTPSSAQYGATRTQDPSGLGQAANTTAERSVTTQVFDDASTLTRDNTTGATSSKP
jgi:hypothetical protein